MVRAAFFVAALLPVLALAVESGDMIQRANNDLGNIASLQRGARNFVNYCLGCHSAQYVRYNRLAKDLGISESQLIKNLMFTAEKPYETMNIAMPRADAQGWFGQAPPDLSLIARSKGTDYVYSYLRSFYVDESSPTGVDNLVLPGTSMPHVLWELQGLQRATYTGHIGDDGNVTKHYNGFEQASPGKLTAKQFDQFVRDLVNFLDYVSEPVQLKRQAIGVRVLIFLAVFFVFAYMLKREYWKDVH